MFGAAAWPRRSSGPDKRPASRRAMGPWRLTSVPSSSMLPAGDRRSPDSAARSSSCPLPATPPMPRTSPRCTDSDTSRSGVPNAPGAGRDRFVTFSATSPSVVWRASGVAKLAPTIISASSRADVSLGVQVATFLPKRRIVAVSQSVRISSSLCEIYRIDVPSARSLFSVWNRISTSCGVRTLVGSSMINSLGSCRRQRMISTRWRSPADRVPTMRDGSSGRPYSSDTVRIRSASSRVLGGFSMPRATFSATFNASNREKC